jgi:mannose-6-phosphate isomerase-like protein (cupin superfamily)
MVKLVKFKGPFTWHKHDHEDEMFLVVRGNFNMELRDKTITLNPGEFLIVPKGVEHRPNAEQECEVMLFEPATTLNTVISGMNSRKKSCNKSDAHKCSVIF